MLPFAREVVTIINHAMCQPYKNLLLLKNKKQLDVTCYSYFTSYILNMFRTLICPSSGVCYYVVELPHWLYFSWIAVCWS